MPVRFSVAYHLLSPWRFLDVPSAPSAIDLLLCTGSEMVLGWRAPARNGGAPVRGYYLDERELGMEVWREVNVKPAKERVFKVSAAPARCSSGVVS